MPESERALLILLGYAANQINCFCKMVIFSTITSSSNVSFLIAMVALHRHHYGLPQAPQRDSKLLGWALRIIFPRRPLETFQRHIGWLNSSRR
jgi:hypothetical protein